MLMACSDKKDDNYIARVFSEKLYFEEVADAFAPNLSKSDSLTLLQKLVNDWIIREVKLHRAKQNNKSKNDEIERLVDEYRNDLLLYHYESDIVAQNLDTVITVEQMRQYFYDHPQNFELKKNILRLMFVKIKSDSKLLKKARYLIKSEESDGRIELSDFCQQNADNWFLDDAVWLDFNDILKEIPIKTYDEEQFLQNNKYFEITEGHDTYLIFIKDYRIKNSVSAFEFEKENIKSIILNKRKIELLKKMQSDLKQEAELNKDIENFVK